MTYLLYILGFAPSIVWLLFYLRKDKHPEPNYMILKVFAFGMIAAFFTIFVQLIINETLVFLSVPLVLAFSLNVFLGAGLAEEGMKYLGARQGAFKNKELDEPTDIVLYMIVAALGFAAIENILYLGKQILNSENLVVLNKLNALMPVKATLEFLGWRFISATFLHALCAGLLGYFLAMAFYYTDKRKLFIISGIVLASFLHGLYDWSIIMIGGAGGLLIPLFILIFLGCFVGYAFRKLKKMQSVCEIDA